MIRSFRHKWLEKFFRTGSKAGIQPQHANKLRLQLARLDAAKSAVDMDLPGWRLHSWRLHILTGDLKGHCSIWVNGNWRLTFTFEDGDAILADYQDYH